MFYSVRGSCVVARSDSCSKIRAEVLPCFRRSLVCSLSVSTDACRFCSVSLALSHRITYRLTVARTWHCFSDYATSVCLARFLSLRLPSTSSFSVLFRLQEEARMGASVHLASSGADKPRFAISTKRAAQHHSCKFYTKNTKNVAKPKKSTTNRSPYKCR